MEVRDERSMKVTKIQKERETARIAACEVIFCIVLMMSHRPLTFHKPVAITQSVFTLSPGTGVYA